MITIWDLDPQCTRKRQRGEPTYVSEPKSHQGSTEFPSRSSRDSGATSKARSSSGMGSSITAGMSTLQQLRQVLTVKHGSTVAAWRAALDPDMKGRVSFGTYCIVCLDCGFHANAKSLWQELCGAKGWVSFRDIDADCNRHLDNFRQTLLAQFGSLVQAWQHGLDVDGKGVLDEAVFV